MLTAEMHYVDLSLRAPYCPVASPSPCEDFRRAVPQKDRTHRDVMLVSCVVAARDAKQSAHGLMTLLLLAFA